MHRRRRKREGGHELLVRVLALVLRVLVLVLVLVLILVLILVLDLDLDLRGEKLVVRVRTQAHWPHVADEGHGGTAPASVRRCGGASGGARGRASGKRQRSCVRLRLCCLFDALR
jgi:hypothetical protein